MGTKTGQIYAALLQLIPVKVLSAYLLLCNLSLQGLWEL